MNANRNIPSPKCGFHEKAIRSRSIGPKLVISTYGPVDEDTRGVAFSEKQLFNFTKEFHKSYIIVFSRMQKRIRS